MKVLRSYLTLKRIGEGFYDPIEGLPVYYYKDCYGDVYMKHSRWALFSVKVSND